MTGFTGKRLEMAERAIEAARGELATGEPGFASGHAYYAMFYTAEALLAERSLTFSSHGALHGAFGHEFARTRELDPQLHRWLITAFRERQEATYGVEGEITSHQAEITIDRAGEFLAAARKYLERG